MTQAPVNIDNLTFKHVYDADQEIQAFGQLALAMFALSLYLRLEDVQEFATNAITDQGNDHKVDLCYIDIEDAKAIIAQSLLSPRWDRTSAPVNKASDLTIAIGWLLSADISHIPLRLRNKAQELRDGILRGEITSIELLYIHNCPESENVRIELATTAALMRDLIHAFELPDTNAVSIGYKEIGLNTIEDLYRSRDSEILVEDMLDVPESSFYTEEGEGWKSIVISVPGDWIRQLYVSHRDRLFSANFRDYLGATDRRGNINQAIKQTIAAEPANFWVFNNGITALTHELRIVDNRVRIHGISIINGAQTSGSLGESVEAQSRATRVLCRIVECQPEGLVHKIILYNNTQNEIKPADLRSNDDIQQRLRLAFEAYHVSYIHRRSALRTRGNAITAASIARALCAFHGDPQTAYRNAKDIFAIDRQYQGVFPSNITPEHIYLVATLSAALDKKKSDLRNLIINEAATTVQEREYEVLRFSASKHFMLYVVGGLAEQIMGRRITNTYEWKCRPPTVLPDPVGMVVAWTDTLDALLPLIATAVERKGTVYDVQRSAPLSKEVIESIRDILSGLGDTFRGRFDLLNTKTSIS